MCPLDTERAADSRQKKLAELFETLAVCLASADAGAAHDIRLGRILTDWHEGARSPVYSGANSGPNSLNPEGPPRRCRAARFVFQRDPNAMLFHDDELVRAISLALKAASESHKR